MDQGFGVLLVSSSMSSSGPKLYVIRPDQAPSPERPLAALTIDEALAEHLDALYASARVLTGDHGAAEDLVQETAIAAFRAWGELRTPAGVKGWFLRILRNTFLNAQRHAGRRPPFADIDIEDLLTHPVLQVEPAGLEGAMSDELVRALESLPIEFREVLWLLDVEGLTVAEAGDMLDVPVGTAASRAHRARRLLRERLSEGRRK